MVVTTEFVKRNLEISLQYLNVVFFGDYATVTVQSTMRLFVKTAIGTTAVFEVKPTDTIYSLKAKLYHEDYDSMPANQYLWFAGKTFQEERATFEDYNIKEDSTLQLIL